MQLIIGLIVGLVLFLCCILSFIMGCKVGKDLGKGNVPQVNLNPVKAVQQHIEHKQEVKAQKEEAGAWENLFNYDGFPQKKEVSD